MLLKFGSLIRLSHHQTQSKKVLFSLRYSFCISSNKYPSNNYRNSDVRPNKEKKSPQDVKEGIQENQKQEDDVKQEDVKQEVKDKIPLEKLYQDNINQLGETYKILRDSIDHLPVHRVVEILKIYSNHRYDNDELYTKCEKSILRHINSIKSEDFISAMTSFSLLENKTSPTFNLMMENKFIKTISKFNMIQIYEVTDAFSRMNIGTSKLYRSLNSYYLHKLNEFTLKQQLDMAIMLINSGRLLHKQVDEILYNLYEKLKNIIKLMKIGEFIKFILIFHSKVLHNKQNYVENESENDKNKSETKNHIMSTLYGDFNKIPSSNNAKSSSENSFFAEYNDEIEEHLLKLIEVENNISLRQYLIIIQIYRNYKRLMPDKIIKKFNEFLENNKISFSPVDFMNIYRKCLGLPTESWYKIKAMLDRIYKQYIEIYINDFDYTELGEIWKTVDYCSSSNAFLDFIY